MSFNELISYWKLRKIDVKAGAGFVDNPLWDDINFSGFSLGAGASSPDFITLFGNGSIQGYSFDGNAITEQLFGGDEIKHSYLEGSDIFFHLHIMPTNNVVGNIKFFIEYEWLNRGDVAEPTTTISTIIASGGTAWKHIVVNFPAISGAGKKIGSHVSFRLYRVPSDIEDTYPHDVVLDSVGIHFQQSSLGSRQMTEK